MNWRWNYVACYVEYVQLETNLIICHLLITEFDNIKCAFKTDYFECRQGQNNYANVGMVLTWEYPIWIQSKNQPMENFWHIDDL